MNRLPEAVNQQFNQLFAAITHATDDLKLATADASMAGNFALVTSNMANCQQLISLEQALKNCLNQFSNPKTDTRNNRLGHKRNHTRKARGRIRVTLAGRQIEKNTIAETFFEALKGFGLDKVASLNKVVTSIPLVSRRPTSGYQTQRTYNGWHITTHVNRDTARSVLSEIARELNMPIKIELIED